MGVSSSRDSWRYPWITLTALKGDPHVLAKIDETEKLLKDLRKTLSR
jgi:hypothetical protein